MILLYNCALDELNLGLSQNGTIISQKTIKLEKKFSKFMVFEIKKFLDQNECFLNEIKILYFTNGPGSFTSLRLGLIFAKTWNLFQDLKIYTIDTLSALTNIENGFFSIKATNNQFYTGEFQNYFLLDEIYVTDQNQTTEKRNVNIIENMLTKIKLAKIWDNWQDVEIKYVKKL